MSKKWYEQGRKSFFNSDIVLLRTTINIKNNIMAMLWLIFEYNGYIIKVHYNKFTKGFY